MSINIRISTIFFAVLQRNFDGRFALCFGIETMLNSVGYRRSTRKFQIYIFSLVEQKREKNLFFFLDKIWSSGIYRLPAYANIRLSTIRKSNLFSSWSPIQGNKKNEFQPRIFLWIYGLSRGFVSSLIQSFDQYFWHYSNDLRLLNEFAINLFRMSDLPAHSSHKNDRTCSVNRIFYLKT